MTARPPLKILMIGHSYVVALNRRLCREVANAGGSGVEVTVAAPSYYWGDLRPITLEPLDGEPYTLDDVGVWLSRKPQLALYARKLRRILRSKAWDIVHAWEEPYILLSGQVARWTPAESTLIFSSFQNQPKNYPPPFASIERYCLRRASGWTAFGTTIAENLRNRRGYIDRPMRVIPLGVDLDVFRPDDESGSAVHRRLGWQESGPPVVGFLGRFVPEKGLGILTRALDRLPAGSWRAMFVGGGPMEGELKSWASRYPDHARVVTGVRHDDVPPYVNAMDLMAAPSQTRPNWREQLGRMLLEAMACGVPVVASDSGEIPYVVADAGVIVPEADEDAWVDNLRRVLDSPELRLDLRRRGLDRVRDVYAWPLIGRQFLEYFLELHESRCNSLASRTGR